jgi:hypothetical protein
MRTHTRFVLQALLILSYLRGGALLKVIDLEIGHVQKKYKFRILIPKYT